MLTTTGCVTYTRGVAPPPATTEDLPGWAVVYVVDETGLSSALADLSTYKEIAFDAEGENLGRTGPLTIATFLGIGANNTSSPAYVVDVQSLGGERVFSRQQTEPPSSLRALLEDASIVKVTFDCRGDSDALSHQFGVTLRG
eukprot:8347659-Pyramimonas_sp.AAC.1